MSTKSPTTDKNEGPGSKESSSSDAVSSEMISPSTVTVKVTWSNISKTYPPLEDSIADKIFSV